MMTGVYAFIARTRKPARLILSTRTFRPSPRDKTRTILDPLFFPLPARERMKVRVHIQRAIQRAIQDAALSVRSSFLGLKTGFKLHICKTPGVGANPIQDYLAA